MSPATTRSHSRAMLRPAPAATPRTLAIVGWGSRCSAAGDLADVAHAGQAWTSLRPSPCPTRRRPSRSRRRHRSARARGRRRCAATSLNTASSSFHITSLTAFLRSGRFIVTVTIPSARSTSNVSQDMRADDTEGSWASTRTGGSVPGRPTTCSSSPPSCCPRPRRLGRRRLTGWTLAVRTPAR